MAIFRKLLSYMQSTPAAQARSITRSLCQKQDVSKQDIDTLISLGPEAVEAFYLTVQHENPDLTRCEQIIDTIAEYHFDQQASLAIALLAAFIDHAKSTLTAKTISVLVNYGLQAAYVLQQALTSEQPSTRIYAAKALAKIHDTTAVNMLIDALQDSDSRVRSEAAEALGAINQPNAIAPLLQMFNDQNWLVRESASTALSQFNHEAISRPLIALLSDHHPQKRIQALHTLGLQQPEHTSIMISALDDSNIEVQYEAINTLAHSHNHIAILPLLSHFQTANNDMKNHLAQACGSIGIKPVAALLSHDEPPIRMAATEIIALHGDTQMLPLLCDAWQHEKHVEAAMRLIIAIGKLAVISDPNTPDHIIKTLISAARTNKSNTYHAKLALEVLQHPLAEQFVQLPLQQTKVAIHCPNCLETLLLKQPLTHQQWSCKFCYLSFNINTDKHGQLIVSPVLRTPKNNLKQAPNMDWFEVLQVNQSADKNTIKRAFRSLLKQYHPDKVATLGIEFKHLAEEKTQLLTWALRTGIERLQKD